MSNFVINPYWFVAGETQTCYQTIPNAINGGNIGVNKYIGNKFSTGAIPVGKSLNQITFWLYVFLQIDLSSTL